MSGDQKANARWYGSLNDVWISRDNGHIVSDEDQPTPIWSSYVKNYAKYSYRSNFMLQGR